MSIITLTMLYLFAKNCLGLKLIDLPDSSEPESNYKLFIKRRGLNPSPMQTTRHWLLRQGPELQPSYQDEKDLNIKNKISTLVEQTIHDTESKIKSIQPLKESHRDTPSYRVGFVLNLVKKTREVLNELFNAAVKHRDSWKALEQLKIFELIVHTNVDTTNLVRQLVEIHMQNENSTSPAVTRDKTRVVLI